MSVGDQGKRKGLPGEALEAYDFRKRPIPDGL